MDKLVIGILVIILGAIGIGVIVALLPVFLFILGFVGVIGLFAFVTKMFFG